MITVSSPKLFQLTEVSIGKVFSQIAGNPGIDVYMYTHTCICIHTCIYVHAHTCVYICAYTESMCGSISL